jgi:hypothetical protein
MTIADFGFKMKKIRNQILIAMLYFRISETNISVLFVDFYPLSNFPQGGKVLILLPP